MWSLQLSRKLYLPPHFVVLYWVCLRVWQLEAVELWPLGLTRSSRLHWLLGGNGYWVRICQVLNLSQARQKILSFQAVIPWRGKKKKKLVHGREWEDSHFRNGLRRLLWGQDVRARVQWCEGASLVKLLGKNFPQGGIASLKNLQRNRKETIVELWRQKMINSKVKHLGKGQIA